MKLVGLRRLPGDTNSPYDNWVFINPDHVVSVLGKKETINGVEESISQVGFATGYYFDVRHSPIDVRAILCNS